MHRLAFCIAAISAFMMGAPAAACAPPSIQFDLGSDRIRAEARSVIDEVAAEYRARRGGRVQLRATTDSLGSANANLQLSRRRAEAVKTALVRRGIPVGSIDIIAEGEGWMRAAARATSFPLNWGAAPEYRVVWLVVVDGGCSG